MIVKPVHEVYTQARLGSTAEGQQEVAAAPSASRQGTALSLEVTSKGIGRQGIVLKHWNSLQKEHVPCRHMPLLVQL